MKQNYWVIFHAARKSQKYQDMMVKDIAYLPAELSDATAMRLATEDNFDSDDITIVLRCFP